MNQSHGEKKTSEMIHTVKPVGQTAAGGFQIGVRRTLPISTQEAWSLLISPEGVKLWIGEIDNLMLEPGKSFAAANGITGELRVVKPMEQLRMRWQRIGWKHPSTLQVRILPASQGKATISIHQENLEDMHAREIMKEHWEQVQDRLRELIRSIQLEE